MSHQLIPNLMDEEGELEKDECGNECTFGGIEGTPRDPPILLTSTPLPSQSTILVESQDPGKETRGPHENSELETWGQVWVIRFP